jgi:hypothetical protein
MSAKLELYIKTGNFVHRVTTKERLTIEGLLVCYEAQKIVLLTRKIFDLNTIFPKLISFPEY